MGNPIKYIDLFGMMSYSYNWDNGTYQDENGKEVEWNTVYQNIQTNIDVKAYLVDDTQSSNLGFAKLKTGNLLSIANYASDILQKNSLSSISFKLTTQQDILNNGLEFSDLFLSINSFDELGPRSQGYADVDPNTGITNAYGDDPNSRYYFKSYVNFNSQVIQGHSNPLYATGYLVAHELLHQLNDKAEFMRTGNTVPSMKAHTIGYDNLNREGSATTIPNGPLKGSGFGALHQSERIPMLQLIIIKKYFLQKRP